MKRKIIRKVYVKFDIKLYKKHGFESISLLQKFKFVIDKLKKEFIDSDSSFDVTFVFRVFLGFSRTFNFLIDFVQSDILLSSRTYFHEKYKRMFPRD